MELFVIQEVIDVYAPGLLFIPDAWVDGPDVMRLKDFMSSLPHSHQRRSLTSQEYYRYVKIIFSQSHFRNNNEAALFDVLRGYFKKKFRDIFLNHCDDDFFTQDNFLAIATHSQPEAVVVALNQLAALAKKFEIADVIWEQVRESDIPVRLVGVYSQFLYAHTELTLDLIMEVAAAQNPEVFIEKAIPNAEIIIKPAPVKRWGDVAGRSVSSGFFANSASSPKSSDGATYVELTTYPSVPSQG
jgi:hypothetical protein